MKTFEVSPPMTKRKEFDAHWKKILKECTQIVKACADLSSLTSGLGGEHLQHTLLFRGMSYRGGNFIEGSSPVGRKPKDTAPLVHRQVNKIMKKYGFVARRDNSLFTTSKYSHASGYGNVVYMIFPKDGFHFTWSPEYADWYNNLFEHYKNLNVMLGTNYFQKLIPLLEKYRIFELRRTGKEGIHYWSDPAYNTIVSAQVDLRSILGGSKKYVSSTIAYLSGYQKLYSNNKKIVADMEKAKKYLLNYPKGFFSNVVVSPKIEKELIRKLALDNKDLEGALGSGHEILVNGNYYGILYDDNNVNVNWVDQKIIEYKKGTK